MCYYLNTMNLDSKNNTILVLSDSHQEIDRMEYILKHENYDIVVHLGDHFDSFTHNSEYDAEKTCNFLKKWMFKDNFFTCVGNHDISYLNDNPTTICSGYDRSKDVFISDCLGNFLSPIRDKFKWYIWINDFLCSHAGINTYHFDPMMEVTKDGITKWLDKQIKVADIKLIDGEYHWLYGAGAARGGRQNIGGITWQDFSAEFEPIEEVKQLVGHTSNNTIIPHHTEGSLDPNDWKNIDIDCHLSEYLMITNSKITIKKFIDL